MKLLDYIRGLRKGKEAHRLEKESMRDSFLADALDGFHQAEGDHELKIDQLRKQITMRSAKKRTMYAITWSIAACLVLGVGISSYLIFMKKDKMADELIALETASLPQKPSASPEAEAKEERKANADTVRNANASNEIDIHNVVAKAQQRPQKAKLLEEEIEKGIDLADFKVVTVQDITAQDREVAEDREIAEDTARATAMLANELATKIVFDIPADTCQMKVIAINGSNARFKEVLVASSGNQKRTFDRKDDSAASSRAKIGKFIISEPVIGKKEYRKYLREHLIPPKDDKFRRVKGEVTVTFYVDANGNPRKITVTKSLCKSADKEAVRLIQQGPKWTVGHLPVEVNIRF